MDRALKFLCFSISRQGARPIRQAGVLSFRFMILLGFADPGPVPQEFVQTDTYLLVFLIFAQGGDLNHGPCGSEYLNSKFKPRSDPRSARNHALECLCI